MIGYIEGDIIESTEKYVIVKAGQVGYQIYCPQGILTTALSGNSIQLWIELVHREGAIELFGFKKQESRDLFKLLTTISGIGPRSGLGILDYNSPAELRTAIRTGDISYLTKVSGIGKKTAEKILIELRDKMPEGVDETAGNSGEIVDALMAMGYNLQQARDAARSVQDSTLDMQSKLKTALQFLSH